MWERFHEVLRFAAAGAATNGAYFAVLALLLWWDTPIAAAGAVAYALSLVVSYFLQSRFTFRSQRDGAGVFARYLITHAVGMGINSAVLHVTVSYLQLNLLFGQGLALALVIVWNFLAMKYWVFRKATDTPAEGAARS